MRLIHLVPIICAAVLAGGAEVTRSTAAPQDAVAAFLEFYAHVERRLGGSVNVEALIDAMNAKDGDPKSLARIKTWDANRDGYIDRSEGAAGVEAEIASVVNEQMAADADGDGQLAATEFALAVPDVGGEKTASGLTKRQQIMFSSGDANGDGRYSRQESRAANSYRHFHSFLGRAAAFRARVLDTDHDGKYNLEEFAAVYGVAPGQPVPAEVKDKFGSKSFGAGNHTYYHVMMRIIHMPLEEIKALEARLDGQSTKTSRQGDKPVSTVDAIASLQKLFDVIDADGDGKVPLAVIFDALAMQEAEARQVKSIRGLDVNGDGVVTRAEAATGFRAQMEYQVSRVMNTDADGDGSLTPLEYSLSFPDPNGKAGSDGLTPAQARAFKTYDANGDGKLTRAEVEDVVNRSYESSFWRQRIGMRARKADRNGDKFLDESEFEFLEGKPLTEQARKRFETAGAKDGRLRTAAVSLLFLATDINGRDEVEKSMDLFEKRLEQLKAQGDKQ